jgi:hypothetical protein
LPSGEEEPCEEDELADQIQTGGGGGHGRLYFIVGALVVVVGIGAFFMFGGKVNAPGNSGPNIKIETPKAPAKTQ